MAACFLQTQKLQIMVYNVRNNSAQFSPLPSCHLQMDFEKFKTVNMISKETFDQITPGSLEKVENQEVPPPPPPVHYTGR